VGYIAFSIRYSHEYLVWFYKEKFIPVARDTRGKFTTVFYEAPREHSRKPDLPYQMIQAMYPTLKKIDVFSREPRDGWDQYGDQCAYFSSLPRQ
jgi:N6-adenosine-specific RNA methylase IME4